MGEKKKLTNITVYRKKPHLNIGIFIFGIIFIYLAFSVLMYLTSGQSLSMKCGRDRS